MPLKLDDLYNSINKFAENKKCIICSNDLFLKLETYPSYDPHMALFSGFCSSKQHSFNIRGRAYIENNTCIVEAINQFIDFSFNSKKYQIKNHIKQDSINKFLNILVCDTNENGCSIERTARKTRIDNYFELHSIDFEKIEKQVEMSFLLK